MKPRVLSIVLALIAAACLAYAAATDHWLVNVAFERGVGLRFAWSCIGACTRVTNSELVASLRGSTENDLSSAFVPMGWATLVLLVAAVAGLVVGAILAIVRAHPRLPIAPTTVALLALMLGLITGCVFVATKPGPAGWVGVGTSFWMFGAGAVLGIAAAQQLARVLRPPDPDLLEDAMNPDQF
jgi:hypothetical protein